MQCAAAIFLNGPSSTGKTSPARALQPSVPEPVVGVSNDKFIFMAPDHVLQDDRQRPKVLHPLLSASSATHPHRGLRLADEQWPRHRRDWLKAIGEVLQGFPVLHGKGHLPYGGTGAPLAPRTVIAS